MGAKLGRNERGWEASVVPIDLTARGKEVFGVESLVCLPPLPPSPPFSTFFLLSIWLNREEES